MPICFKEVFYSLLDSTILVLYMTCIWLIKYCLNQIVFSKEDNSNGILFSSRPLKAGETLEVHVEDLSSHIQGGGLEIGVTDLDPVTLASSLPRTATDLGDGRTVIVSGWTVALNGKQIDMINHNMHDIKVSVC